MPTTMRADAPQKINANAGNFPRSMALQKWINEQGGDVEKAKDSVCKLPENLQKELEKEAKEDSRVRTIATMKTSGVNTVLIKAYLDQPGVVKPVSLNLQGLHAGNLPTSTWLENSALFGVAPMRRAKDAKSARHPIVEQTIYSRNGSTIIYSGEPLYQFDWDVYHYLLRETGGELDKVYSLSAAAIVDALGLARAGSAYAAVRQSIERMSRTSLYVSIISEGCSVEIGLRSGSSVVNHSTRVLHLVEDFSWSKRKGAVSLHVKIDGRIARLFDGKQYGLVDLEMRKALRGNELAKKLQCLFSTQQANRQIHRLEKLLRYTRLTGGMGTFTRSLTKALDKLREVGAITAYWISKPKRGNSTERGLVVWKKREPCASEPVPCKRGLYVCKYGRYVTKENEPLPYMDEMPLLPRVPI